MAFPSKQDEIKKLEQVYYTLQEEILRMEHQLTTTQQRQRELQENRALLRNRSRRDRPVVSPITLYKEALQEIDSFIFTTEYKLKKAHEQIVELVRQLRMLDADWYEKPAA